MEIEIESKKNNPLLNRTEVYFTINHEGQGTPNREIVRSELADKLNTKRENIIVSSINSSFGINKTTGYAKVYSSLKDTKGLERDHILKRNKIGGEKKKEEKPAEAEKPAGETPKEETPAEPPKEDVVGEDKPAEPAVEQETTPEPPADEQKEGKPTVEAPKNEEPAEEKPENKKKDE